MDIISLNINLLKGYDKNARTHSKDQIIEIANSIKNFGFNDPIEIDANHVIISGHARLEAAKQLGLNEVPVIIHDHMDDDHRKAYILAANRIAMSSSWDSKILQDELFELHEHEFDLKLTGFTGEEINEILNPVLPDDGLVDEDECGDINDNEIITKQGDMWTLGNHRLLCGDPTNVTDVEKLLSGQQPNTMITDPPYGVKYEANWRADAKGRKKTEREETSNLMNDDQSDWYDAYILFTGSVAYVWHASAFTDVVMDGLRRAGFEIKQQIIWNKNIHALSRSDYHWKHEPCQPAGTMVRTPSGLIAIENLKDGDGVLSYDSYSSVVTGKKDGKKIKVASRHYEGDLYSVDCDGKNTKTTDAHQFSIKYNSEAKDIWCTYIMRRGNWWRVGLLRAFNSRGFGLTVRIRQEKGDEAWILNVHESKSDASIFEQVLSVKYGIPTTCWETDRNECLPHYRTEKQIQSIYDYLDLDLMKNNALKCLKDHGRIIEYPLITKETCKSIIHSKRITTIVRSCNLLEKLMCLPIPEEKGDGIYWSEIKSVSRYHFAGNVYSMDVEDNHHYIADGIITHNCWYAVKKGADRNWLGGRTQMTIWDVATVQSEKDKTSHPTQKPVEIYMRSINHHTNPGEYIYDPFGGSGTLIIACEKSMRRALTMELDPKFCDVIIRRWEKFSGKKAILEDNINEFDI